MPRRRWKRYAGIFWQCRADSPVRQVGMCCNCRAPTLCRKNFSRQSEDSKDFGCQKPKFVSALNINNQCLQAISSREWLFHAFLRLNRLNKLKRLNGEEGFGNVLADREHFGFSQYRHAVSRKIMLFIYQT